MRPSRQPANSPTHKLDLHGLGFFSEAPAGFRVHRYHLDVPWPYIYATDKLLLRVDQRGPDYAQFDPPGGSTLFRRERYQTYPSLLVWIKTGEGRAFTNFYRPTVGFESISEPDEFFCDYTPERVLYHVCQDGIACDTELFVPRNDPVLVMTCSLSLVGAGSREPGPVPREIELVPVMRPHFAAGSLAPWDRPSLYQRVGYSNERHQAFLLELRSPAGLPETREYAFVISDFKSPDGVEVDYEQFTNRGTFENPQCLLRIDPTNQFRFGEYDTRNSVNGEQGVVALRKRADLQPGESLVFTVVLGRAESESPGKLPEFELIDRFSTYFGSDARERAKAEAAAGFNELISKRRVNTPDDAFNRYVNEWLPLQLRWVSLLDRGWPSGMRGVRDNAQDAAALIPLYPDQCRKTILTLFSVQRSDGWFPRQYSAKGRQGQHDLRNYVDGGVWVWELFYDYLCFTKDFGVLDEHVPWLDIDDEDTILTHALRIADYYLSPDNLGEHGLCLIREGDWNDSVNRAGLEGRGESVMVSCQVVMLLRQLVSLANSVPSLERLAASLPSLNSQISTLNSAILTHALNFDSYLNGVFNDDGNWIFSPSDPDGKRRVNIPVNAFGIISGVLRGDDARRALHVLKSLKQADGWPLFWPPIGDPPIPKLGRIGEGDLAPGLGENGTPYNHGSHGFFGRAASAIGDGDLLIEILRYMLPYDQDAHPVERAKTAPYAVVNHWKTAPGLEGRGGDCFLSGSISTALRSVYNGLFGIKPTLDGLALDPALPGDWQEAAVEFTYLGARVHLTYVRAKGAPRLFVNGEEVTSRHVDPVLQKKCLFIPDRFFTDGGRVQIVYHTG